MSWRRDFDAARDPYTARNALGITSLGGGGGGFITAVSPPLQVTGTTLSIDLSAYLTSATAAATYQPLDADLTAIAALTGTNVIYYRSAANTWTAVTVGTGLSFTSGTLASTVTAGAPVGAEYITSTSDATLTAERVLTDTATITWDRSVAGQIKANAAAGSTADVIPHCGRLEYVSTTALSFKPFNGDRIKIAGVLYAIQSGGIAGLANTGIFLNGAGGSSLAINTVYYVYAFNNSGTVTADFSTTAHATSTTAGNVGVEIKSGDNTRTLIGLIKSGNSGEFLNSAAIRYVISWFNRRNILLVGPYTATGTTTSAALVELTTASRAHFLNWGDEALPIMLAGSGYGTAITTVGVSVFLDGVSTFAFTPQQYFLTVGVYYNLSTSVSSAPSEGYHYITPAGLTSSGTLTTSLFVSAIIRG